MQKGLVSIVIPAYNSAPSILECLESIQMNSYPSVEVIVVNDGSNDNTEDILSSFNGLSLQIVNQENQGVSLARNTGMKLCSGEFVLFLDADDMISSDFIDSHVKVLGQDVDLIGVGSMVKEFGSSERTLRSLSTLEELYSRDSEVVSCPSGYLWRVSSLVNHGVEFNEKLSSSADKFFLIEVLNVGNLGVSKEGQLLYRVSESSMSNKLTAELLQDRIAYYNLISSRSEMPNAYVQGQAKIIAKEAVKLGKPGIALKYGL